MTNTIDIHGYNVNEAKVQLNKFLNNLSPIVTEVTVIHGYSSTILSNYVRKQFKHKKVARVILTMNKGETILVLK